ncbi:hypothetical protein L1049_002687 [Liquidambar formosana]|uniref:CCT domain-containing protein n=1 Tax=Liquidambar formosana TaxID=63359 RepID=A0AAP0NHM5_LIQFO
MCSKKSSMIKKKTTVSLKPARKTRTKTRKPKFLSLRLDISPENSQQSGEMTHHHHQLDLFPLHPENLVEDKDMHDENMAYFFGPDGGASTLTGLLDVKTESAGISSEEDSISPPPNYAYRGQNSEEGGAAAAAAANELVRAALRNRERDASEEKWVCYSEVVEKKEEEVTSCAVDVRYKNTARRLSLKLDYEEILNAWSDKGPLYIEGESPQTVPDLHDDFLPQDGANVLMDGWGSVGNAGLWRVPEMGGNVSSMKMEEEGGRERWKMGQREASVLRYKEKRQSRLFAKRIRYEVRKLNAEKRPRMKGRFVKRS